MKQSLRNAVSVLAVHLASLGAAGCLKPDPSHCANREGNATCLEGGAGSYCSICVAESHGCVSKMPEISCYRPGAEQGGTDSDGTSTGSETIGTEDSTTTDTPTACDASMAMDPSCPTESPYCVGGSCGTCTDAGGDSFCSELDAATPVCSEQRPACLECTPDAVSDCEPPEVACDGQLQCVGCVRHADCAAACDLGASTCFDGIEVVHVDNAAPGCPAGGDGSVEDPYCSLAVALGELGQEGVVRLAKGSAAYTGAVAIGGGGARTIVILGEDEPVLEVDGTAIDVSLSSRFFLDGVVVRQSTQGLQCTNSEVWLTSSAIQTSEGGIGAQGCEVHLRGSRVVGHDGDAVAMSSGSLDVRSSVIAGNATTVGESGGIRLDGTSLEMAFATIVNNGAFNLSCSGAGQREARSSVIAGPGGSSIVGCNDLRADDTFLDVEGLPGDRQVQAPPWDPSWFSNVELLDYHVRVAADSPFRDVGLWTLGDPFSDMDGDPIDYSMGTPVFAGADQP